MMENNKDEAIRVKVIAERKIAEKDFAGAKEFVLKAQTLYPGLEGLSQLLTTLDVYIPAENKVCGEEDWYGILGVNLSDDPETVRQQYRKLALMLHPDKNKSVGAEGAFKLLSEAWSLLSDRVRRLAYNRRRTFKGFQQKVPTNCRGPSAPSRANGFYNFSNSVTSNAKTQIPPACPRTDTFWTICHKCKMHYEYLRVYLNNTLLCPNCHEAFLASETAPPSNFSKPSNSSSRQGHQIPGHHVTNRNLIYPGRYAPVSFNHANGSHQANEKLKRQHVESQAAGSWESLLKKRRGLADNGNGNGNGGYTTCQLAMGNSFGLRKGGLETDRVYGFSGINSKPSSVRELTPLQTRYLLIHRAWTEIRKKLSQWSADIKKEKVRGKEKERSSKCFSRTSADDKDKENTKPIAINVPDPDFHDFDLDRTESSFGDNQVWAAYDNDDGMPRFYAMIHKVISLNPFKMRISWLNSKTSIEFGPIDWVGSGFFKTCADFRAGKHEINTSLNSFSHKVKWAKGPRGTVRIFPKRGDVWALYRNWSPDWNEHTPDTVIHQYDMVQVLEDYNEVQGISVAPLIKITGFRTVFHAHTDPEKLRRIHKEEMFRFSHQVPNHLLTGLETQNAPKGCQELDPAATPLELLQVITDADEATMKENDGQVGKELG